MSSSITVKGRSTQGVFETYVEHLLVAFSKPGQVVVDKLGAHSPRRVRELIEDRGYELIYLISLLPELQPDRGSLLEVRPPAEKDRPSYQRSPRGGLWVELLGP